MKVTRVNRVEFELENGDVFPIDPPLERDVTVDEFQEHYNRAYVVVSGIKDARSDSPNIEKVG